MKHPVPKSVNDPQKIVGVPFWVFFMCLIVLWIIFMALNSLMLAILAGVICFLCGKLITEYEPSLILMLWVNFGFKSHYDSSHYQGGIPFAPGDSGAGIPE